jgi:hypothetical protein
VLDAVPDEAAAELPDDPLDDPPRQFASTSTATATTAIAAAHTAIKLRRPPPVTVPALTSANLAAGDRLGTPSARTGSHRGSEDGSLFD